VLAVGCTSSLVAGSSCDLSNPCCGKNTPETLNECKALQIQKGERDGTEDCVKGQV
jgi:hypothetical protein